MFQKDSLDQHPAAPPSGLEGAEKCPDELDVVTGLVDDPRVVLTPDHPVYAMAQYAWTHQDRWTLDEHASFWRGFLGLWPARGRTQVIETQAWALRAHIRRGRTRAEAAERMGFPDETVRRRIEPVTRALEDAAVTDYVLPRVYAPAAEAAPNPMAYPNLDGATLQAGSAEASRLAAGL